MQHTLHRRHHHTRWDASLAPALVAAPGDVVTFDVFDASGGQITEGATVEAVRSLDPDSVNPVTGPVRIDGAAPGDALVVTVLELEPSGWGWTANIPGFGLLADDFPDAALHLWRYDPMGREPAAFGPHARVPLKPFIGTIGVVLG